MESFANRLNTALEAKGISPAELSRRIGVAEGTISNYRKGVYEPKQKRLQLIAKVLGVSVPFLLGYDVPMEEQKEQPIMDGLSEAKQRLINVVLNMSEERAQAVLLLLDKPE